MSNFMSFLEQKIMPVALKISNQPHLAAIRKGIVSTLPLTIIGSMFTVINNIPIEAWTDFIAPHLTKLDIPFRLTVGLLALYAVFGIGYSLATTYKLDPLSGGLIATVSFLITVIEPTRVTAGSITTAITDTGLLSNADDIATLATAFTENVIGASRWMDIASLGASALFGGIVASLIAVEIYHFCKKKNLTIKMPAGVPPEVGNSFAALIPFAISILLFWSIRHLLGFNINSAISAVLMPLKGVLAGNSLLGGLLTVFLICFFWVLGIHGPAIMGPVIRPIWNATIAENMEAFNDNIAANALPNIFTEQFLQWFIWIGGAGATLPLVCLFLFSKAKSLRQLGRLSIVPGIFNINEPAIFGTPIVMNPILAIPFIIAPLVMTVIAYVFTILDIVPMMMAQLTFTLPAPLAAIMSTDWNWMSGVLVVINFFVALIIYYPFFKLYEKQQVAIETNTDVVEEAE